jgi:hypothetical protein
MNKKGCFQVVIRICKTDDMGEMCRVLMQQVLRDEPLRNAVNLENNVNVEIGWEADYLWITTTFEYVKSGVIVFPQGKYVEDMFKNFNKAL